MNTEKEISKLHFITDDLVLIEQALDAGIDWVQLRMKEFSQEEMEERAHLARELTLGYDATLIINDHINIATAVSADGVHLGKEDLHPKEARKEFGEELIIGATCNTQADIASIENYVDYIGAGPFRFTKTKQNLSPVLGLEGYKAFNTNKPVIAIGGITPEDVQVLLQANAHGVAVSSAIAASGQLQDTVELFLKNLEHAAVSYC